MQGLLGVVAAVVFSRAGLAAADSTSVEIPAWLTLVAPFVMSGGFLVYYTAKVEKRLKASQADKGEADTEEVYQRLYRTLGADLEELQMRYATAEAKLGEAAAERETMQAKHERTEAIMRRQIADLHVELENLRAEMGLIERRDPPQP